MKDQEAADINWLAFQYLSAELDADQVEWFESLLAEDQTAREALAAAVELTDAIVACRQQELVVAPSEKTSSSRYHPLWWMAAGAALCLMAVLIGNAIRNDPVSNETAKVSSVSPASLAITWEETQTVMNEQSLVPPTEGLFEEQGLEDELTDSAILDEPETPSWMESALLGMSEGDEDDDEWEG